MGCDKCTTRVEVSTVGIDEALQGLSCDPAGSSPALSVGLRVPPFIAGSSGPSSRFLFLLATRTIAKPTRIRGLRQLLTIGGNVSPVGGPPLRPIELAVQTPTWRFPDSSVSWHLVYEPSTPLTPAATDSASFAFMRSGAPALLYETFTSTAPSNLSGAPSYYTSGLTSYTAPEIWPDWRPIGSLGAFYDVRFPWLADEAWESLDLPICAEGAMRVSFYASVLQSNGGGTGTSFASTTAGLPPEETFLANLQASGATSIGYWRVGGAIVFEDEEG